MGNGSVDTTIFELPSNVIVPFEGLQTLLFQYPYDIIDLLLIYQTIVKKVFVNYWLNAIL